MPEKSSNTASIVVAVITLLLILGGVYLLNNSVNPGGDTTSDETTVVDTDNSDEESEEEVNNDLTEDLALPEDEVGNSDSNDTDTTDAAGGQNNDDTTTSEPETVEPETETVQSPQQSDELASNQFTATYGGTSDGVSSWTLTDCGLPNAQLCAEGVTLSLIGVEGYTPLTVGNEYLFNADFAERNSQLEIDLIESITPVN